MLIKFTVGNFLSFKEKVTLDLTAKPISEFDMNVFPTEFKNIRLLKSAVLYGFNSSGKSNLLKALTFVKWFIVNSSKDIQAEEEINVDSFLLNTNNKGKPSFFEVEFLSGGLKYRYGFLVDRYKIHEEWLFQTKKLKEYELFIRKNQSFTFSDGFLAEKNIIELTRNNALFLSVLAQFNNSSAINILKFFKAIGFISGIDDKRHIDYTANMLNNTKFQSIILSLLKKAKLGFNNIIAERVDISEGIKSTDLPIEIKNYLLKSNPKEFLIQTEHDVFDEGNNIVGQTNFILTKHESKGTRKFFSLAGPIIEALINGQILLVDEFDARLHPELSTALINLFNSIENNPKNAQLIIASHDSSFLGKKIFRRDQVNIVDKDDYGASKVTTLFEQRFRKDASYEKDYLGGKSVRIPKIDISDLFLVKNE